MYWIAATAAALAAGWYFFPLLRPKRPRLPVLLIGKTGAPLGCCKDKSRLSSARLERLLCGLQKQNFQAILPRDILGAKPLPQRPVLLLFYGGYQTFESAALPLLEKYGFRAAVALPVGHIGEYDAWQSPQDGPWQPLLNAEQIRRLRRNPSVEFISQTLSGASLNTLDEDAAVWQLQESKARLISLYGITPRAVYFPQENPIRPAVLHAAARAYPMAVGNRCGNNPQTPRPYVYSVFPVTFSTCLPRLFWKLTV